MIRIFFSPPVFTLIPAALDEKTDGRVKSINRNCNLLQLLFVVFFFALNRFFSDEPTLIRSIGLPPLHYNITPPPPPRPLTIIITDNI